MKFGFYRSVGRDLKRSLSRDMFYETVMQKITNFPKIHERVSDYIVSFNQNLTKTKNICEQKEMHISNDKNNLVGKKILEIYDKYIQIRSDVIELRKLITENKTDQDILNDVQKELDVYRVKAKDIISSIYSLLISKPKFHNNGAIMEIRPGVGGSEAALFAENLLNMYQNYAHIMGWKTELVFLNRSTNGFLIDAALSVETPGSFDYLRHESGVHRVQRVPETESKGRVHTSTAAVAVLPHIPINNLNSECRNQKFFFSLKDVKIETMKSGGKGGQHVNTTNSAVKLIHLPTGITVSQQDQRSQAQNKSKAFLILNARLAKREQDNELKFKNELRNKQIPTVERADKIRTYNFSQNRVSDHRCNFSLHNFSDVLNGSKLSIFIDKMKEKELESTLNSLPIPKYNNQ